MLKISIPTPCHEDWNKMTPTQQGAFCGVCSKNVVDFTLLSDDEVKNYFIQYKGQKTCGRFYNHQLTQPEQPVENILLQNIPLWKKFLAAVLICFGTLLTGCNDRTTGKLDVGQLKIAEFTTDTSVAEQNQPMNTKLNLQDSKIEIVEWTGTTVGMLAPPIVQGDIDMAMTTGVPEVLILPDQPNTDTLKLTSNDNKGTIIPEKNCDNMGRKDTLYYRP